VIFSARAIFYTELAKNIIQRANPGKTALKQIQTHEGSKKQEVLAHEYRTGFHSQRQRYQDKSAGNDTDYAFCIHYLKLLLRFGGFYCNFL
jgi:regulator of replication initiation timing